METGLMDAAWASLGRTLDLCFIYMVAMIGSVLLAIAGFKFAAWVADRRKAPPSSNGRTPGFEPGDAGPTPAGGSEESDG